MCTGLVGGALTVYCLCVVACGGMTIRTLMIKASPSSCRAIVPTHGCAPLCCHDHAQLYIKWKPHYHRGTWWCHTTIGYYSLQHPVDIDSDQQTLQWHCCSYYRRWRGSRYNCNTTPIFAVAISNGSATTIAHSDAIAIATIIARSDTIATITRLPHSMVLPLCTSPLLMIKLAATKGCHSQ